MTNHSIITGKQLSRLLPVDPREDAFCDVITLVNQLPYCRGTIETAMNTRGKPGASLSHGSALLVKRMPAKLCYSHAVLPFETTVQWVIDNSEGLARCTVEYLVKAACWQLANRVVRGTANRTNVAKMALKAYGSKWPEDEKLERVKRLNGAPSMHGAA